MSDKAKRAERRRKRRKSVAAGRPASYSQLYKDDHSASSAGGSGVDGGEESKVDSASIESSRPGRKGSESIDWQGEYRHVFSDLRNVLIVSVLIFAVMIGVGIFL